MTKKLYHDDSYQQTFISEVVEKVEIEGNPGVILNQTLFYPSSGGQPHDTGVLNNIPVVDVVENRRHEIVHLLKSSFDEPAVDGRISWKRRFDHMQQHTGQHILSQVVKTAFRTETISFHLGEESSTIDLDRSGFHEEMITRAEEMACRIIFANRPVIAHVVDKKELHAFSLRKTPTVEENIRIIEIKDFDFSPCGGTHCKKTGEIGILKIRQVENYKGGSRIHFVCGWRAIKDYQRKSGILRQLSGAMSAGEADLHENIQKIQKDLKSLRSEHNKIRKQLIESEAVGLAAEFHNGGGVKILKKNFYDRNPKELKILAQKVVDCSSHMVVLFASETKYKGSLVFHCSENLPYDMGRLMQTACAVINGRGGGRKKQAQGGGTAVEKLVEALQVAEDTLMGEQ